MKQMMLAFAQRALGECHMSNILLVAIHMIHVW